MKNKGFSLVELIVVIAIMAILVGVAVPVYSSYIEKAQKSKDEQMIDEIKHAIEIAGAAGTFSEGESGYIVLSTTEAVSGVEEGSALDAVLKQTFGNDYANTLKLSYDGWSATFQGSSFYDDNEGLSGLMGTVETLTDALGAALENKTISDALTNGAFANYADGLKANSTAAKADAAVFYVAETTGKVSAAELQNAVAAMQKVSAEGGSSDDALGAMNGYLGSTLTSTAALYALAEGYARYYDAHYTPAEGVKAPSEILAETVEGFTNEDGTTTLNSAVDAYSQLMSGFNQMGQVDEGAPLAEYMSKYMSADLNAYAEAMKMVSASKDNILNSNGNLGDANYFSTDHVKNLVSSYSDGCVFVYVIQDANGQLKVTSSIDKN